jgi:hypothetical protein
MELKALLEQFDWTKLSFFVLFTLPGFISLRVWRLIVPSDYRPLKDELVEAIGFGTLNAMISGPLVFVLWPNSPWLLYLLLLATLVLLPIAWPFMVKGLLRLLQSWDLILNQARNGWDDFFLRREQVFVIVHLKDGRRFGGYYGRAFLCWVAPSIRAHISRNTLDPRF